jgi:hypothetical protein
VDSELAEAIEQLYRTFSGYPLRDWTEPCLHCNTVEEEKAVHRRPLRELEPGDLVEYACNVLLTWGEIDDFRHFLPRLFELVATDGFGDRPDPETILGALALAHGDWWTWPTVEQEAVERYLMAWWRTRLSEPPRRPPRHQVDTVLGCIALAVDDLTPYLDLWANMPGDEPVLHLALLLEDSDVLYPAGPRLHNPWMERRPAQEAQILAWFQTVAAFLPRFVAIYDTDPDLPVVLALLAAYIYASDPHPPG